LAYDTSYSYTRIIFSLAAPGIFWFQYFLSYLLASGSGEGEGDVEGGEGGAKQTFHKV
jgi:hypothetical protein